MVHFLLGKVLWHVAISFIALDRRCHYSDEIYHKQLGRGYSGSNMGKASSKKGSSTAKYDIVIKTKATTTKIIDITNETVRMESNDKGQVTGRHYSGVHWDTVEATMLADGTAGL